MEPNFNQENRKSKRVRAFLWRLAAFVLAVTLVVAGYLVIFEEEEIEVIPVQVSQVE